MALKFLPEAFTSGLDRFIRTFRKRGPLVVGRDGIRIDAFLSMPVSHWLAG